MTDRDWSTWLAVLGFLLKRYGARRMVNVLRAEASRLESDYLGEPDTR